jgi:hypothetical protein
MAYIGFGSILQCNGRFQWRMNGGFIYNWFAAMYWWSGGFRCKSL